MKHQVPLKPNPFETIWSPRKFDMLGKKRKGEERRVGLSRSRAIEKRKNTLLKEYEQSNKASVFVDKRIGEHNDELNDFDKAIRRAQREHQEFPSGNDFLANEHTAPLGGWRRLRAAVGLLLSSRA